VTFGSSGAKIDRERKREREKERKREREKERKKERTGEIDDDDHPRPDVTCNGNRER